MKLLLCQPTTAERIYELSIGLLLTWSPIPIALYFTAIGTTTQRVQATTPVSNSNNTAASSVASSGNSGIGQHMLGATPVALTQTLTGAGVGSLAPITQPGLIPQVPRPALAPSHTIQPSLLSQRLVLTSQAQARLPSKWPALSSVSAFSRHFWHNSFGCSTLRPLHEALLICVQSLFLW